MCASRKCLISRFPGKNNVQVLPKDSTLPRAGYLSLHQGLQQPSQQYNANGGLPFAPPGGVIIAGPGQTQQEPSVSLKWTPNQLMNGSTVGDKSASWQQAIAVDMRSITFMHCHQDTEDSKGGTEEAPSPSTCSATLTLVATDGTQHPPFKFPPGGHLAQFLQCLESSLAPRLLVKPPVCSSRVLQWSKKDLQVGGGRVMGRTCRYVMFANLIKGAKVWRER